MKHFSKKNFYALLLLGFPLLAYRIEHSANLIYLILGISGFFYVKKKLQSLKENQIIGFFFLTLVLHFSLFLFLALSSNHYPSVKISPFTENYLYFLFAIPLYFILVEHRDKLIFFLLAFPFAGILAFIDAIIFFIIHNKGFYEGHPNSIRYADWGLLVSFFSLLIIPVSKKYYPIYINLLAFILCLLASFMTESRGFIIALIPLSFFLFILYKNFIFQFIYSYYKKLIVYLGVVSIIFILFISLNSKFSAVISSSLKQMASLNEKVYELFVDKKQITHSSFSIRVEMIKAGWYLFQANPLLGVGEPYLLLERNNLIEQGKIDKILLRYNNSAQLHNEYINALAISGILGLIILLLMYFLPFLFFIKNYNNSKIYSSMGLTHILAYMLFAVSETPFDKNSMIILYVLPLLVFIIKVQYPKNEE